MLVALRENAKEDSVDVDVFDVIGSGFFWDGVTVEKVVAQLRASKSKTVHVRVNSVGGVVYEAEAIRSVLAERAASGSAVKVSIIGLAASAATLITDAGTDVAIAKAAFFMIHDAAKGTPGRGTAEDHQKAIDELQKVNANIVDRYVAASARRGKDKSAEDFRAAMKKERYFTADEAVEWGLVDRVIEDVRVAACADLSKLEDAPQALRDAYALVTASAAPVATIQDPAPAPSAPVAASDNSPARGEENDTMKLSKEVLALLGLTENADQAAVEAAIQAKCGAPLPASQDVMRNLGARSDAEGQTRASALTKLEIGLFGATGCTDHTAALNQITAWRLGAENAVKLDAKVKTLEGEVSTHKLEAAIQRASVDQVVDGVTVPARLPPAMHQWARTSFATAESLENFLASAPLGFATATVTQPSEQPVALTDVERDVCKSMGMSEATFLEQKKLDQQRRTAQAGV